MLGMAEGTKETKEDVVGMRQEREVACSEGHQSPYLVLYQANLSSEMQSSEKIMLMDR